MTDQTLPGPAWIPGFLAALADTGVVKRALEAAGITNNSAYFQRRTNLQFATAWDAALGREAPPSAPAAVDVIPARNGGWRTPFLEALAETSNVTAAAVRANVPLRTVYNLRRTNAGFAGKWSAALCEGYDNLEMELLGYLRDPRPERKMDVASALRLLAAHRETVARERALTGEEDEQAVLESIDAFIEEIRQRRATNAAILIETSSNDAD